ncbi:ribonuclease H-like domain-containing protein [Cercophora newfieldiana]|uniref:Ribonuclease H-like domain-containing protein n=1 Tax=Cercophora newfieldiana TaxID=92897 RepID=A0AA40CJF9_9PEZI|nr:ribonuclease H-like domain-containing protein [Cercophora newfieldiana]
MTISGSGSGSGLPPGSDNHFPPRPSFGSAGSNILLWANYFALNINAKPLWKYFITVERLDKPTKGPPNTKGKDGQKGDGKDDAENQVRGRKLFKIIELALKSFGPTVTLASDYKAQVIALQELKFPSDGVQVVLADTSRPEKWTVLFHPADVDMGRLLSYLKSMKDPGNETLFPKFPAEIDALNIILGHTTRSDPKSTAIGSSRFFAVDDARKESAPGLDRAWVEILRGYFQSVRPATGRLLLNTNATHGVFRRPVNVGNFLAGMGISCDPKFANQLRDINRVLALSRVEVTIPSPKNPIVSTAKTVGFCTSRDGSKGRGKDGQEPPQFRPHPTFPFRGPGDVQFFLRQPQPKDPKTVVPPAPGKLQYGTYVTVQNYYLAKYNYKVNASLPLINVGSRDRPVYVAAELVTILPGQAMKTRLRPDESDAMIKFACRAPPENAESIVTRGRALLRLDEGKNSLLNKFGITVGKSLVTVVGRELQPPTLSYTGAPVLPRDGGWLMRGVKVVKPGRRIASWTYLYAASLGNDAGPTAKKFVDFLSRGMGIDIETKPPQGGGVNFNSRQLETLKPAMAKIASSKPHLVIVFLDSKDAATYNYIKQLADCDLGFHTVCVTPKVFDQKGQDGFFANVGLKVNMKFGGVNHRLAQGMELIGKGKTMVVGYDVTHPTNLPPDAAKNAPSIAGLVASIDKELSQWPAHVWDMKPTQEMLDGGLIGAFQSRLRLWQKTNNRELPQNLLIYRDGVSEGQFVQVLDHELPHIRKACEQMYPPKNQPRITLIVSVKRHQTRFFPTDPDHIHPRSKSPKEGTVVDRGVTNVRCWDFFLQAHASLQGTARPAHYTVLLDEIFRKDYGKKAADVLEKVTHDMCYMFGRATKAVSICPPAYYADLVCTRSRCHNSSLFDGLETASVSTATSQGERLKPVHANVQDAMYYI